MRQHWKGILAGIAALATLAFLVQRVSREVQSGAPPELKYQEHRSASRWLNRDLRASWRQVESLVKAGQREQQATTLLFTGISYTHLCRWPEEALVWTTLTPRNPGITPLERIEQTEPTNAELLGYYTVAGAPLNFATKLDPNKPGQTFSTVWLAEPLQPKRSTMLLRVHRRAPRATPTPKGERVLPLGRLADPVAEVNVVSLSVPAGVQLAKYGPREGAAVATTEGRTTVTWISSQHSGTARAAQATIAQRK